MSIQSNKILYHEPSYGVISGITYPFSLAQLVSQGTLVNHPARQDLSDMSRFPEPGHVFKRGNLPERGNQKVVTNYEIVVSREGQLVWASEGANPDR